MIALEVNFLVSAVSYISFFAGSLITAYVLAACTMILAFYHLIKEAVWCYHSTPIAYLKSIQNYNELVLYSLSMVFVFIFLNRCGCPTGWQWQIGIFVIFLGWINMIFFASNFPGTAIYVIMFKEIFLTFFRLTLFAVLLVLAFSLILFMMFYDPNAEVNRSRFTFCYSHC